MKLIFKYIYKMNSHPKIETYEQYLQCCDRYWVMATTTEDEGGEDAELLWNRIDEYDQAFIRKK